MPLDKSLCGSTGTFMKQPGLDNRHRDEDGTIRQKRGDTLNKNLPKPIPGFSGETTLQQMRDATGKISERAVRAESKKRS
jgi:hypothetical protein